MTWEYASPLSVVETITDIGGGNYRYEYSFTNLDISTIWDFNLYTTLNVQAVSSFSGYDRWTDLHFVSAEQYRDAFDPRVLDDDIIGAVATSYEYWAYGEEFGIQPNDIAKELTYLSTIYDPSPKYYAYITIETSEPDPYLLDRVSAVGQTIPEPATLLLICLGSLLIQGKK